MDIVEYKQLCTEEIISFIETAHEAINKTIDFNGKDSDLLNLEIHYGAPNAGFWCILNSNQIIGTMALRPVVNTNNFCAEIRRLYIHPNWQNKGIGSELIDFAINFSKANFFEKLRVTTSFDRIVMIYLLQKKGFYQIQKYRKSSADLFFEMSLKPKYHKLYNELSDSIDEGEIYFKNTLILNPVENVPEMEVIKPCISYLHGLYNTDSVRNSREKINTKIQFSGRDAISSDVNKIYQEWANLLEGDAVSMRLLSGLHAHIIVFMVLTTIGDHVAILPEIAGGHMATKAILQRLGLIVHELEVDYINQKIDVNASLDMLKKYSPKVIFIDRSEGLVYEDFSWLKEIRAYKIFDASQYLTNIISKDYPNPFHWGFDLILTTLHKNVPGPQRAMICTKKKDKYWSTIKSGMSTYVSNMHVFSIYSAGILLKNYEELLALSKNMLNNTIKLEQELQTNGLSVVQSCPPALQHLHTHHIWLQAYSKEEAFSWYLTLERIGILVNYRKLPYNLGFGLRLGLSAATYCGLCEGDIPELAQIISNAIKDGYSDVLKQHSDKLITKIKRKNYGK
jgi:glycine/serine hydroxymethyltransferase/N-acetylglutamate synthase-like GNAT family acetyltransferase